jgi:hypothetical protein
MTRLPVLIALLLSVLPAALAQEKPAPPLKPQPDVRATEVGLPDTTLKASARDSIAKPIQGLPKFDLPEYVITGAASMDLPDAEKQEGVEPPHEADLANPLDAARDRSTTKILSGERRGLLSNVIPANNGRIEASSGTYFTSKFGLWYNRLAPDYSILGGAQYGVSKAYIPFTNRSGGQVNVIGGMTLHGPSEWSERGSVRGELGYGSETYRFYGSPTPDLTRTLSRFHGAVNFESPRELVFNYGLGAGLDVTGIADSSSNVSETLFHFGGESNLLVGAFQLDGSVDLTLASVSYPGTPTLPFLDVALTTPRNWYSNFFVQGALHLYVTQGMLSQKFARFYPNVSIGYKVFENTVASASYLGRVQFNTLSDLLDTQPYLSATSIIRQSDLPLNLVVAIETDWNKTWRSRLAARFQTVKDYPLFTEGTTVVGSSLPGHPGIWTTSYLSTTSLACYEADLFAKFDANSYFTLSLEINSSKNSSTQRAVPYLPDLRLSGGFSIEVLEGLQVLPTLAYVGKRVTDLYVDAGSQPKLYGVIGLRAEYAAMKSLSIFADCQNLTDTRYEEWHGYRATPFILTAGIGYRW